jgi:hypothetical protein
MQTLMSVKARISRWHLGKLAILWAWGALISALSLTYFLSTPVLSSPVAHLITLLVALIILIALSIVTWMWFPARPTKER